MKTVQNLSIQERSALAEFQRKVEEIFPEILMHYTVFGSRARRDADRKSDLDLLLEREMERLAFSDKRTLRRLAGEVSMAHDPVLSVLTVDRATAREHGEYSIITNIKEEGIPL